MSFFYVLALKFSIWVYTYVNIAIISAAFMRIVEYLIHTEKKKLK